MMAESIGVLVSGNLTGYINLANKFIYLSTIIAVSSTYCYRSEVMKDIRMYVCSSALPIGICFYQVGVWYLNGTIPALPFAGLLQSYMSPWRDLGDALRTSGWYGSIPRFASVFSDPNFFALYLIPVTLLSLVFYIWECERRRRYLMFFVASFFCILITGSRSGLVGLLAGGCIVLLFHLAKPQGIHRLIRLSRWVIAASILLLLGGSNLSSLYLLSVGRLREGIGLDPVRYELMSASWRTFLESPLFGGGVGSLISYTGRSDLVSSAHTVYLTVLGELGLFGFVPFCLILLSLAIFCLRLVKAGTELEYGIAVGFLGSFVSILTVNLVYDSFWVLESTALLFALLLGLVRTSVTPIRAPERGQFHEHASMFAQGEQSSATANNPHGWQETEQAGKVLQGVGIGAREGVAAEAPPPCTG